MKDKIIAICHDYKSAADIYLTFIFNYNERTTYTDVVYILKELVDESKLEKRRKNEVWEYKRI